MRSKLLVACLIAVVCATIFLPTLDTGYQTGSSGNQGSSTGSSSSHHKPFDVACAYADIVGGKCYVNENNRLSYLGACDQYCTSKYGQDVRASTCQNGCLNFNSLAVSGSNLGY